MSSIETLLKVLLVALITVVLLPLVMMLLMTPTMGMWSNGTMVGATGTPWMWGLWIVVLAVVGGIGYLLYSILRDAARGESDPAIEELRATYARGDLSDEEFETRLERLRQ